MKLICFFCGLFVFYSCCTQGQFQRISDVPLVCGNKDVVWAFQIFGNFSNDTISVGIEKIGKTFDFFNVTGVEHNGGCTAIIFAILKSENGNILYATRGENIRKEFIDTIAYPLEISITIHHKVYPVIVDTVGIEKYYTIGYSGEKASEPFFYWKDKDCSDWTYD